MYIMDKDLKLQDWEFKQRKYLPYEVKLRLSARRIIDWYDYYDGMVYTSFSGGIDSTVLGHMVDHVMERRIPRVFVDTENLCIVLMWRFYIQSIRSGM